MISNKEILKENHHCLMRPVNIEISNEEREFGWILVNFLGLCHTCLCDWYFRRSIDCYYSNIRYMFQPCYSYFNVIAIACTWIYWIALNSTVCCSPFKGCSIGTAIWLSFLNKLYPSMKYIASLSVSVSLVAENMQIWALEYLLKSCWMSSIRSWIDLVLRKQIFKRLWFKAENGATESWRFALLHWS